MVITEKRWAVLARNLTFSVFKLIVTIAWFLGLSKDQTKKLLRDEDVQNSVESAILDVHSTILRTIKKWKKDE